MLELQIRDIGYKLNFIRLSLESGYYKFQFYIHYEDFNNVNGILKEVYTHDFFNKNLLNKLSGSFGYTEFITIVTNLEYLEEENTLNIVERPTKQDR